MWGVKRSGSRTSINCWREMAGVRLRFRQATGATCQSVGGLRSVLSFLAGQDKLNWCCCKIDRSMHSVYECLPTALPGNVQQSVMSVPPFVYTLAFERNGL